MEAPEVDILERVCLLKVCPVGQRWGAIWVCLLVDIYIKEGDRLMVIFPSEFYSGVGGVKFG